MINNVFPYAWYFTFDYYKEFGIEAIKLTIKNWFENFSYLLKIIKWFFQRGLRGWADCDWWDMDYYLLKIIIPMLKKLKENKMGYPANLTESQWNDKLDKMIEGFEAAKRVLDNEYYKEVSGDSIEAIQNASRKEVKQWYKLSRADEKLFKKRMKLFSKYFFDLWD